MGRTNIFKKWFAIMWITLLNSN